MKLHQKVRRHLDVEGLGEVRDLQPRSYAAETGGVGLQDAGGARRQILAEMADGVDALPDGDRDAGRSRKSDMPAEVFGWKRFLEPVEVEVFEKVRSPLGLRVSHRLVGVDHDVKGRPDRFAHGPEPLDILQGAGLADL